MWFHHAVSVFASRKSLSLGRGEMDDSGFDSVHDVFGIPLLSLTAVLVV